MIRLGLAALLLASPSSAQIVSLKTAAPPPSSAPAIALTASHLLAPSPAAASLSASLLPSLAASAFAPAPAPLSGLPVVSAAAPAPAVSLKTAVSGFGHELAAAPAALVRLFDGAASAGDAAGPVAAAAVPLRPLDSIRELKLGSYNVLNLFQKVGKHVPDPDNPGKLKRVSDARPKEEWSLREQGKAILENDLDVVTLQEVENAQALEDFNRDHLGGKYKVFLIEGNDERGIDVAFLVKKDLPLQIEHRSHKDETWIDPVWGGGPTRLFSRDLTALVARAEPGGKPLFVLFGTHFKSKRDRDGRDPESRVMRGAQVKRSAEIIGRYRAEFGADVPVMIAGDFNGVVPDEPEFRPLFEAAGLVDAFDATPNPPARAARVTHTYHPRDGAAHQGQMDAILVSKGLRGAVKKAEVYRYRDAQGRIKPIPNTYEERSRNPSDHFPVVVTLDFVPLKAAAGR